MSDHEDDRTADTEMFQAFVDRHPPTETSGPPWVGVVLVAAALVIVLALVWFVLAS